MRRIIKASMEDVSTVERFRFSLRCAACGYCWESQPVRFSKAGVQLENEGKRVIFQALYQRDREDAFERAVTEALEHFSVVNGKIVESWGYWPDREIEEKLLS